MSEAARRETAKSTAQRTWSSVRDSWKDTDELSVVVGAIATGRMAGRAIGNGFCCCPDDVTLSSISMDATETVNRTSDNSAAVANLSKSSNQIYQINIQFQMKRWHFDLKFVQIVMCVLVEPWNSIRLENSVEDRRWARREWIAVVVVAEPKEKRKGKRESWPDRVCCPSKNPTERSVREKRENFHARHFLRAPLQTTTTTTTADGQQGRPAPLSAENKNQTVKREEEKRRRFIDAHYRESTVGPWFTISRKRRKRTRAPCLHTNVHSSPFNFWKKINGPFHWPQQENQIVRVTTCSDEMK